jgi:hypothetical protein
MFSYIEEPIVIPAILEDSRKTMETWGVSGTFDPFDKIYEVGVPLELGACLLG